MARARRGRTLEEPPALLGCKPVPESDADPPHPLHSTNSGRQFGTQKTGVCCLVRDAPNGGQPKISCGWRISALFKVNPISKHHRAIEREARLGAVPTDELANRVLVRSLATGRCQAVEDGRFGMFEIGERQNTFRCLLLASFRLSHRRRPPSPSPASFIEWPSLRRHSPLTLTATRHGSVRHILSPLHMSLTTGARFVNAAPAEESNAEFPYTLDLRRPLHTR